MIFNRCLPGAVTVKPDYLISNANWPVYYIFYIFRIDPFTHSLSTFLLKVHSLVVTELGGGVRIVITI